MIRKRIAKELLSRLDRGTREGGGGGGGPATRNDESGQIEQRKRQRTHG